MSKAYQAWKALMAALKPNNMTIQN